MYRKLKKARDENKKLRFGRLQRICKKRKERRGSLRSRRLSESVFLVAVVARMVYIYLCVLFHVGWLM